MDIERIRGISEARINAGKQVSNVRNTSERIQTWITRCSGGII